MLLLDLSVVYNGIVHQANEVAQARIPNMLLIMKDSSTVDLVAKDNSINTLTKFDMLNLLKECIHKQSNIILSSKQV